MGPEPGPEQGLLRIGSSAGSPAVGRPGDPTTFLIPTPALPHPPQIQRQSPLWGKIDGISTWPALVHMPPGDSGDPGLSIKWL